MVIQRWQSALLLLAGMLLGISIFSPVAEFVQNGVETIITPLDYAVSVIMGLLATLLTFLAIFLYKNLALQIKTVLICVLLSVTYLAVNYVMVCTGIECVSCHYCNSACVLLALIMQIFAVVRIRADREKLRSYDRIR